MDQLKILIVDDEKRIRDELDEFLADSGYIVFQAGLATAAFEIVRRNDIDVVILDIKLPEIDGLATLKRMKESFPEIEVIMITGHGDMESAISAMRSGASDYLNKPLGLMEVMAAIERTSKFIRMTKRLKAAELDYSLLSKKFHGERGYRIVGENSAMRSVIDLMSKVAGSYDTGVLITGESGTGKELVARGIHHLSSRKHRMFYPVNVSAMPGTLFDSELFGHKRGSFTGAFEDKNGWFEAAHGGTLFLDEICDMDPGLQVKLLRVIEDKKVKKIGSNSEVHVDVRVISATNRNIERLIRKKEFRKDLFHRLNTFSIHLPPLRERKEDIPLLLDNFVSFFSTGLGKQIKKIDPKTVAELTEYPFPGNVRELKNLAERAVILCQGDTLSARHFTVFRENPDGPTAPDENLDLEAAEKKLIRKALKKTGNNKSHAAELLKISWQSLDRRMKKHGL